MKKIYFLLICLFTVSSLQAGNGAYEKAMQKNLEAMEQAKDKETMQKAANAFERVANNELQEWLPLYYAALSYINMSNMEEGVEAKDASLNKAMGFINKASAIAPHESEIVLLEGYQTTMFLSADPANRGQSLSPKAMQLFGKAMQMDPNNPRAYLLMAEMEFGTARFFGGSTEQACALAQKSLDLFEKAPTKNTLAPIWGKEDASLLAKRCAMKE